MATWERERIKLERNRRYLISPTLGVLKVNEPEPTLEDWFGILKETKGHAVALFHTETDSGYEIVFVDRTDEPA